MRRFCLLSVLLFSFIIPAKSFGDLPKEEWVSGMKKLVPADLCRKRGYLLSCWKVSQKECLDFVSATTNSCIEEMESQLPHSVSKEWGDKLGNCIGTRFAEAFVDKSISSKKCDKPANFP